MGQYYTHCWTEEDYIDRLFQLDANYLDNEDYTLMPKRRCKYNSNSYTRGLLEASGTNAPGLPSRGRSFPGWQNPLPASAFQRNAAVNILINNIINGTY